MGNKNVGTEDVQVIKKKPRGGNSPVIGDNGLMLQEGDNAKFLQQSLELASLPKIDLRDTELVQNRVDEYFAIMVKYDAKPTVAGLAMALGIDRRRLWEIKTGNTQGSGALGGMSALPQGVTDAIKKAYLLMENLWENYMLNGKINPVSGIFLGKNNYGYQDKTEYVLTPNTQQDNDYDADSIRQRYLIDSVASTDSETE